MPTLVRKLPARAVAPVTPLLAETTATLTPPAAAPPPPPPPPRPLATPLSADRYQIRFTASAATWRKLQAARDLLRHAIPSGDAGEIVDRALTALIDDLARKKCGAASRPSRRGRATKASSRHIPAKVRRAVWARDQGRCAFTARSGRRCQERGRLEFHHVEPYALGGAATVANIELRCRAHNVYEADLFCGTAGRVAGERRAAYGSGGRDRIRPGTDPGTYERGETMS